MSDGGGALRALLVSFGFEIDTTELKRGEKEAESFASKLKEMAKLAVEAFALEKVKEFVEGQIEAGAQLKVTAERLGTTTDELQAMRLAAGEAGVSVEAMDTSLRFLNRNIGKAASGSGEQAQTFAKLGIALKDAQGNVRPTTDIMSDLADKVAETGGTAEKTRISMELLGRGGSQLIPLLNRGGEAFKEATKDVADLGGGMSGEFVEAAHKAEEAQVKLKFATTSLSSNIVNALLPTVMQIVGGLTSFVKTAVDVEKKSHIVETSLEFLKSAAIPVGIVTITNALRAMTAQEILAAIPVVLFAAAIAAALLAYNDLSVAITGGKSVFGDTFGTEGVEEMKETIVALNAVIDRTVDVLGDVAESLKYIFHFWAEGFDRIMSGLSAGQGAVNKFTRFVTGRKENDIDREIEGAAAKWSDSADEHDRDRQGNVDEILRDKHHGVFDAVDSYQNRRTAKRAFDADNASLADAKSPYRRVATGNARSGADLPKGWTQVPIGPAAAYGTPSVPAGPAGGAAGAGGVVVNQNSTTNIEVHPGSNDPEATAKAVSNAQTTVDQRRMNNAQTALKLP
jgi:hypothetical protein